MNKAMNHFQKVIITGITGQDGSYLAELLLRKGRLSNSLTGELWPRPANRPGGGGGIS